MRQSIVLLLLARFCLNQIHNLIFDFGQSQETKGKRFIKEESELSTWMKREVFLWCYCAITHVHIASTKSDALPTHEWREVGKS